MFPSSPAKPSAEGGVAPLTAASPEEVAALELYAGAQEQQAPTSTSASPLEQATRELTAADKEVAAAAAKQRTAQQLLTKISALSPTTFGGRVDLAGLEQGGGFDLGASRNSSRGLVDGLSDGGGAGLRDLGDEGTRLTLAEASASQPAASTSGSTDKQLHPYHELFTQAAVGTQDKLLVLSEHYFKHHSEKEASIVTM